MVTVSYLNEQPLHKIFSLTHLMNNSSDLFPTFLDIEEELDWLGSTITCLHTHTNTHTHTRARAH